MAIVNGNKELSGAKMARRQEGAASEGHCAENESKLQDLACFECSTNDLNLLLWSAILT